MKMDVVVGSDRNIDSNWTIWARNKNKSWFEM